MKATPYDKAARQGGFSRYACVSTLHISPEYPYDADLSSIRSVIPAKAGIKKEKGYRIISEMPFIA